MNQEKDINITEEAVGGYSSDIISLVCFKLADEEYAFEMEKVQEVIKLRDITPIPQMPNFVLGVINIRGNVPPVFDLRKKFNLNQKPFDEDTKILVVEVEGLLVSIIVDEILDNIKLSTKELDPAPKVKMKMEGEYIKALGKLNDRMITILNLENMHEYLEKEIYAYKKG